jgi:hypothetical protein
VGMGCVLYHDEMNIMRGFYVSRSRCVLLTRDDHKREQLETSGERELETAPETQSVPKVIRIEL